MEPDRVFPRRCPNPRGWSPTSSGADSAATAHRRVARTQTTDARSYPARVTTFPVGDGPRACQSMGGPVAPEDSTLTPGFGGQAGDQPELLVPTTRHRPR